MFPLEECPDSGCSRLVFIIFVNPETALPREECREFGLSHHHFYYGRVRVDNVGARARVQFHNVGACVRLRPDNVAACVRVRLDNVSAPRRARASKNLAPEAGPGQ